jgi:hypothetical protein
MPNEVVNQTEQAVATVEAPAFCDSNLIKCRLERDGNLVNVIYCSPYGGWRAAEGPAGGMVAFPEMGSKVLITKPSQSESWFYLNCIMDQNPGATAEGGEDSGDSPTANMAGEQYEEMDQPSAFRGVPQRQSIQSVSGNGMILSDSYNEKNMAFFTQLHTPTQKKVGLYDTDDNDCIEMETLYHDRIKLTAEEVDNCGAQELHVETESNQNYHCETGRIWIEITEGLDIDLINNSGGASKIPVVAEEFGNINLISRNMDINLTAEGRKEFIGNGAGLSQDEADGIAGGIGGSGDAISDAQAGISTIDTMNEGLGYSVCTTYVDDEGNPIDPYENATVPEEGGSIFIQALGQEKDNQLIQLYSKDKLIVYAKGNVWIAGEKVVIRAEDTLDISAKNKISIHSDSQNVQIDGKEIHLNGGFTYSPPNMDALIQDNHLGVGKTEPTDKKPKMNMLQGEGETAGSKILGTMEEAEDLAAAADETDAALAALDAKNKQ